MPKEADRPRYQEWVIRMRPRDGGGKGTYELLRAEEKASAKDPDRPGIPLPVGSGGLQHEAGNESHQATDSKEDPQPDWSGATRGGRIGRGVPGARPSDGAGAGGGR